MEFIRRLGSFVMDVLQTIVFAIAIFLFMYLLLFQPHKIKGDSMQPNFPDAEYLLTDKVTYRFNDPQRGDVVVFQAPPDNEDEYIKRIIGLPGEKISVNGGKVYINGVFLNESYLNPTLYTQGGYFLRDRTEVLIPENEYFVMGDNRPYSSDSRAWGFVPFEKIKGRAWIIYWPPQNAGKVDKVIYNI